LLGTDVGAGDTDCACPSDQRSAATARYTNTATVTSPVLVARLIIVRRKTPVEV